MLRVNEIKFNKELISIFKLIEKDKIYSLKLNELIVGYGIIREDKTNKIDIYILEQYQNNGYGSYLFVELLKIVNSNIELRTKIDNIKMKKIITKNNGKEIGRNGKYISYVIPKI